MVNNSTNINKTITSYLKLIEYLEDNDIDDILFRDGQKNMAGLNQVMGS